MVDGGHARFVVPFAGGWRQVAEPFELVAAQFDAVGGGVLLDAGDPPGAGDRGDVVALGEQPGQGDLRRGGAGLGGDGLDISTRPSGSTCSISPTPPAPDVVPVAGPRPGRCGQAWPPSLTE